MNVEEWSEEGPMREYWAQRAREKRWIQALILFLISAFFMAVVITCIILFPQATYIDDAITCYGPICVTAYIISMTTGAIALFKIFKKKKNRETKGDTERRLKDIERRDKIIDIVLFSVSFITLVIFVVCVFIFAALGGNFSGGKYALFLICPTCVPAFLISMITGGLGLFRIFKKKHRVVGTNDTKRNVSPEHVANKLRFL